MIYHMVPAEFWNRLGGNEPYESTDVGDDEFIHFSDTPEQLLRVANKLYKGDPDPFLILCVDETKVDDEVRYEMAEDEAYPHLYGLLNREAVVDVVPFPRDEDGTFLIPDDLPQ